MNASPSVRCGQAELRITSVIRRRSTLEDMAANSDDQVYPRATTAELGLQALSLEELRAIARTVPFETGFIGVALLALQLDEIWIDGARQLDLVREIWRDAPVASAYAAFLRRYPDGVLFTQQQLYVAQRLLVEEGTDEPYPEMTVDQDIALGQLIVHATDVIDVSTPRVTALRSDLTQLVAFLMQSGAISARVALLNDFSRSYDVFARRARDAPDPRAPLDEWATKDTQLSLEEQTAGAYAYHALVTREENGRRGQVKLIQPPVLHKTKLVDVEPRIVEAISAGRDWYREQFAKGDQSARDVAWETYPFLRRPFLQLPSGQLVLAAPTAITSWIGWGMYDRLRESAKARTTSSRKTLDDFGAVYGDLVEGYALDLVRSVYGGERVCGDQPYGNGLRTPDVAIALGDDLFLIEVRSGYLSPHFRTSGDVNEFETQLNRLVVKKLDQLSARIEDLISGAATVPGVDIAEVKRIWPVLITADITITEHLWALLDPLPKGLRESRVQTLVIGDLQDLELMMGLAEAGHDLAETLDRRQQGTYSRLEVTRWALEELEASPTTRPQFVLDNWERLRAAMEEALGYR